VVDFSESGCTFCADCVDSCDINALSLMAFIGAEPWSLKATINQFCVNHDGGICRICAGVCENAAIRFHVRDSAAVCPEIDLEKCTGCGQCYRSCPTRAIRIKPV
jgi:ferredoxin-type protein NapF